jgi:hypothetical protein
MMNRIQNAQISMIAMMVSLTVTAPAFATRGDMTNMAAIRHDTENEKRIKIVRIEGALSCDLGAENSGQGCELKLHETGTGRTYNLIEARGAMQLYQGGNKNVIIEGRLADAETIEVRTAQNL